MAIRLVSDNPDVAVTAGSAASLPQLVSDNPNPVRAEPDREEARFSPSGRRLPPLHRFDRMRLDTWRATKAWKVLDASLADATDAVAQADAADDDAALERALDAMEVVALRILDAPTKRLSDLRTRLALISWMAGQGRPCWAYSPVGPANRLEAAFMLMDTELFRLSQDENRAAEARSAEKRAARKASATHHGGSGRSSPDAVI